MIGSVSCFQDQLGIGKRKKDHGGEPMTPAHAADQAAMDAQCAGQGHCDDRPLTAEAAAKARAAMPHASGPGTGEPAGMYISGDSVQPPELPRQPWWSPDGAVVI